MELTWKNSAGIRGLYDYFKFDADDLECIHMDSRIDELIQENPDAYDENLDACIEEAMDSARDEYSDMKSNMEEDIFYLRDQIELVVSFLERVHKRTLEYSDKWIAQKVDNT